MTISTNSTVLNSGKLNQAINEPFNSYHKKPATSFSETLKQVDIQVQSPVEKPDDSEKQISTTDLIKSTSRYAYLVGKNAQYRSGISETNDTLSNISEEEKLYLDSVRPSFYSEQQYQAALHSYDRLLGLLNPNNLPTSMSGFKWVTLPEEGKSRSTDMISPPTFTPTDGGITRTDYTLSGVVKTFIPVIEWRLAGTNDGRVGTAYNQQLPWGFRTYFDRGGGPPLHLGYSRDQYEKRFQELLAKTQL